MPQCGGLATSGCISRGTVPKAGNCPAYSPRDGVSFVKKCPAWRWYTPGGAHQTGPVTSGLMEQTYCRTDVPFCQAGKEKNLKIYLKTPGGEKQKKKDPISERRFMAVCRLIAFALYVELTRIIVSMNDFFSLLWFFVFSGATIAAEICFRWKSPK